MGTDHGRMFDLDAQYSAASLQERALWRQLNDESLPVAERLSAYVRWKAAADLTKTLAIRLREDAPKPPAAWHDAG